MAKSSKKRKVHSNHAENRKPTRPPLRKDAIKSKSASRQQQQQQPSSKSAKVQHPKSHIPFLDSDRILLIGEGDFSFAKSIVEEHGCYDVTATCYDSQDVLFEKYKPQVEEHVRYLDDEGQHVVYNVDATKLDKNKALAKAVATGGRFNVILFNFPHVGGKSTDVNRQVRFNQELLVEFFQSCQMLLSHEAKVVVTLFEGEPYTLWNVRDLARHAGLEVLTSFKFLAAAYPGYQHARTLGNIEGGGGWKGEEREARSYVFGIKGQQGQMQTKGRDGKEKTQKEMQKEMERQRRVRMGEVSALDETRKRKRRDEDSSSDDED